MLARNAAPCHKFYLLFGRVKAVADPGQPYQPLPPEVLAGGTREFSRLPLVTGAARGYLPHYRMKRLVAYAMEV